MAVNGEILISVLLVAFDLAGTFVFALSGAMAAVKYRLDIFGALGTPTGWLVVRAKGLALLRTCNWRAIIVRLPTQREPNG